MITIKYYPVILNGIDKTGVVETLDDDRALSLIKLGYAETVKAEPIENTIYPEPETITYPKKKR